MERTNKKSTIGNMFAAAKEARLTRQYSANEIISRRSFNAIMGGVVAYGLAVNILLCKFFPLAMNDINPLIFLLLYLVCSISGVFIAHKSDNPLISFLGYNMIVLPMGIMLTGLVSTYGGLDSTIVIQAFAYTLAITVIMIAAGVCFPNFFRSLGRTLFVCLIGLFITQLIFMLFGRAPIVLDIAVAALFSLYIGFDFYRSQQYEPTVDNAVDCALDIYVDIINLFVRILAIMAKNKD